MRTPKKVFLICWGVVATWLMFGTVSAYAQPVNLDANLLQQLQETINQQQEQLRQQAAQIQSQADALKAVQKQLDDLTHERTGAAQKTQATQAAMPTAQQTVATSQKTDRLPAVTTTQARVKLALSGQVNRAVNVVNDGSGTDAYFVDSNVSNSRVRFVGTAMVNDDTTLGSRIEIAIAPDESSRISQNVQTGGDFFNQRWAEVSVNSKKYGIVSLGKGDTASNNSAEVDLSKTDIIQNSSIADIASGMLFRERGGKQILTTTKLADTFNNRDGLSRQSRLRYDTPSLVGFTLAGSLISNERADAAVFWGGQGYGFKAAAALAIADPQLDMDKYGRQFGLQEDGSFSLLHGNTGLNLTLSAGLLNVDNQSDATNLFAKLGWLSTLFDFGYTAFGVAYTRSVNLPADNDIGTSASAAVVQSLDKFGTELYLQYRRYLLDRNAGAEVEGMDVGTIGTRIKF